MNVFRDLVFQRRSLLLNRNDFIVSYFWRQTNKVTHSIASASLSHPNPHIFHDVTTSLYMLIWNEMN